MRDYLGEENRRNRSNAALYTKLIKKVFDVDGVLVAHHLVFEKGSAPVYEIPSADSLMFDHEIMGKAFGERAVDIMRDLASVPVDERDAKLASYLG